MSLTNWTCTLNSECINEKKNILSSVITLVDMNIYRNIKDFFSVCSRESEIEHLNP